MGGRVAEELVFDEISTGAQNDLEKATDIARAMVSQYGMSDKVGPLSLRDDPNSWMPASSKVSGHTAEVIDEEVSRLLAQAHERATTVLTEQRAMLDRLSELLLAVETIEGGDLKGYLDGTMPIPSPEEAKELLEQGAAAAVATEPDAEAEAERARAHRRLTLPPAPPIPTVD
jgi:cell division protease FtsH